MTGNPTGMNIAIVEALGIDPTTVRKGGVRITLDGDLGPIIEVEYLGHLMGETWRDVAGVLRRYKLVPLEVDET